MITINKYLFLSLLILTTINGQIFSSNPTELATSGAFLGGRLGTHAINSNPALLGIKTGDLIERFLIDTFNVSYSVELAVSDKKNDLKVLRDDLIKKEFDNEYEISKKDSLFVLKANRFNNSMEAFNFSSSLPVDVPLKVIAYDTTWKTVEKPLIEYRIKLFSTTNKDTIKFYKKSLKNKLKNYESSIIKTDSLYQYFLNVSNSEEEAIILKNSPAIQSMFKSPSVDFFYNSIPEGFSPNLSITFPLRLSIGIENNHINTTWFNKYISADMIENPSIKNDFIKNIPESGLIGSFNASTSALELTYQNFGISLFNIHAFYKMTIPKQLSEIVFEGVQFDEPKDISNFDTRGLIFNETVFSYGKKVNFKKIPFSTYLGIGLRYYRGLFSYTETYEGIISTDRDSVNIYSNINIILNQPKNMASGLGLDLGIYSKINEKFSAQASLVGLGGTLKSKKVDKIKSISNISISNDEISEIIDYNDTQNDSITKTLSILDTTESLRNISIDLPTRLNIAVSYVLSHNIHIKTAFQHTTRTSFFGLVNPKISIGTEIYPNKSYQLLTGISYGGVNKMTFGTGFRIKFKKLHYSFAINQYSGLFNYAKGFNVASEFQLIF